MITVVVVARDEAERLGACLESVREADELLIVDDRSTDGTAELAREHGARVVAGSGTLSDLRALGCAEARGEWVLMLDADERVPGGGMDLLRSACRGARCVGFELPIRTYVGRRWLRFGGWYPRRRPRLYRRDAVSWPAARVHERPELAGPVGRLPVALEHPSFRDLAHAREKHLRYAALAALELREGGVRPSIVSGALRAAWRATRSVVFRGGFLMGRLGLSMAWVEAGYVWRRTRWARSGIPPVWAPEGHSVEREGGLRTTHPFEEIKTGRAVGRD